MIYIQHWFNDFIVLFGVHIKKSTQSAMSLKKYHTLTSILFQGIDILTM